MPIVGAVPASAAQLTIANIPGATTAGAYDVLIQTFLNCGDTQTTITMPSAIQYQ
jgi:hypothetical protein